MQLLVALVALFFFSSLQIAPGLQPLTCASRSQLFATYGNLRETLEHFTSIHRDFARARPKVVADHVKAFRIHALAQDFLGVLEAFRLFACYALCPEVCSNPADGAVNLISRVQVAERLNDLQLDLELVTEEQHAFRASSQQFLREAKQYASTLVSTAMHSGGLSVDWDEGLAVCVSNVVSRLMFPLMKIVALSSKQNESHVVLHGVVLDSENPASTSASYISPAPPIWDPHLGIVNASSLQDPESSEDGELSFGLLSSMASGARSLHLRLAPSNTVQDTCSVASSPHLLGHPAWPRRWRQQAINAAPLHRIVEMLELIESNVIDLSHVYFALRPFGDAGWTQNLSCTGPEVYYDPTLCLEPKGWGGYVYSIGVHPPFSAELRMLGRDLGDDAQSGDSRFMDILRPSLGLDGGGVQTLEQLFYRLDFIWRQANEPSPDVFFLHPAVHNCHAVEYLFTGAPIKPKILVIPINPLVPPPFEIMPRFEAWWHMLRPALLSSRLARPWVLRDQRAAEASVGPQVNISDVDESASSSLMDEYFMPSFWLGQCSLSAVNAVMERLAKKKFKYELHHVDQAFAVYVRTDLQKSLVIEGSDAGARPDPLSKWLDGWFCSPDSRFFSKLEAVAGPAMMRVVEPGVSVKEKEAILCRFLDAHRIPVQKRNFDCAGVISSLHQPSDSLQHAGRHSCMMPDLRGWGSEQAVFDSVQDSAGSCEAHCVRLNCSYWTFDPTAQYGQPLCWIWVGGRPADIKKEQGWMSGDVDCHLAKLAAGEDEPPDALAPEQSVDAASADVSEQEVLLLPEGRELFKQWAITQPKEVPGMRYFIEGGQRGRCIRGFCECFPPFRGPLCEQTQAGMADSQRNFTAALHYLTSDDEQDVVDITHSLPRLWQQFNRRFDYPVVIFNDGLSEEHRERIVQASENRVWFAYVDDYLDIPDMIMKDPSRRAMLNEVKWSLGYRGMCRFRSGTIFLQPVLQNFQYAMTLDTDGYFPAEVSYDPIAAMHAGGYTYTWSHLLPDLPGAVKHFWDHSLMYMRMKGIDPRGTDILKQFVREDDLQWNYQLYMNDIEIVQLDFFRSDPYQDYFRFLDSMGGFWLYRWGDHAVRTIAVGMWLPEEKVYEMDIPYGHQNYCRCSSADLECIREADVGRVPAHWWTCAPIKSDGT